MRMERAGRRGAGTVAAEAVRVRVALEARMASAADPARKAHLFELGEAIELFSRTGVQADALADMARQSGDLLPQASRLVADYVAAHRALVPLLLAAVDADLPLESPEYAEITSRTKDLESMLRRAVAAFASEAERLGVLLGDADEMAPAAPKPH
jgi:hypothetical protein